MDPNAQAIYSGGDISTSESLKNNHSSNSQDLKDNNNSVNPRKRSRELLYLDDLNVKNPFEIVSKKPRFVFERSNVLGKVANFLQESEKPENKLKFPPTICDPVVIDQDGEPNEEKQEENDNPSAEDQNQQQENENDEDTSENTYDDSNQNDEDNTEDTDIDYENQFVQQLVGNPYVEFNLTLGLFEPKEPNINNEDAGQADEGNEEEIVRIEGENDKKDVIFDLAQQRLNDFDDHVGAFEDNASSSSVKFILPQERKTKEIKETKATETLIKSLFK